MPQAPASSMSLGDVASFSVKKLPRRKKPSSFLVHVQVLGAFQFGGASVVHVSDRRVSWPGVCYIHVVVNSCFEYWPDLSASTCIIFLPTFSFAYFFGRNSGKSSSHRIFAASERQWFTWKRLVKAPPPQDDFSDGNRAWKSRAQFLGLKRAKVRTQVADRWWKGLKGFLPASFPRRLYHGSHPWAPRAWENDFLLLLACQPWRLDACWIPGGSDARTAQPQGKTHCQSDVIKNEVVFWFSPTALLTFI